MPNSMFCFTRGKPGSWSIAASYIRKSAATVNNTGCFLSSQLSLYAKGMQISAAVIHNWDERLLFVYWGFRAQLPLQSLCSQQLIDPVSREIERLSERKKNSEQMLRYISHKSYKSRNQLLRHSSSKSVQISVLLIFRSQSVLWRNWT